MCECYFSACHLCNSALNIISMCTSTTSTSTQVVSYIPVPIQRATFLFFQVEGRNSDVCRRYETSIEDRYFIFLKSDQKKSFEVVRDR